MTTNPAAILVFVTALLGCGEPDEDEEKCAAEDRVVGWQDADGDGYGDPATWTLVCQRGAKLVGNDSDCNDDDPEVRPYRDELCNGIDDDCDGRIDEHFATAPWHADADGDGFGDARSTLFACVQPDGYTDDASDCDDGDSAIHPDAPEVCNEVDDDCDGLVDLDDDSIEKSALAAFYADADDDGFGNPDALLLDCVAPDGAVPNGDDCNDALAAVNPDALEVCNGRDDNCDDLTDDDDPGLDKSTTTEWYFDDDEDGFGNAAVTLQACDASGGLWRLNDDDCDDTDPTVGGPTEWRTDTDGDGFGGDDAGTACTAPGPDDVAASLGIDCNDGDIEIHPGQQEVCNGYDDDCDGLSDDADPSLDASTGSVSYLDLDGDGFGDPDNAVRTCVVPPAGVLDDTDCDDDDRDVHPHATEVCNGYDDDCNELSDDMDPGVDPATLQIWYADLDGDGYGDLFNAVAACDPPSGYTDDTTDCDDSNPDLGPPALWYEDGDGDGVGVYPPTGPTCAPPTPDWVLGTGAEDCDDDDPDRFPGNREICGDGFDQDCDGLDTCVLIADGFESGDLDPDHWASAAGFAAVTTELPATGSWSLNMSGTTGRVTSVEFDTSTCIAVSWSFQGKRGPEAPDEDDFLILEFFDGVGWIPIDSWEGNAVDDPTFTTWEGQLEDAAAFHASFAWQFRTIGNFDGFDDYFIDDFALECL